MTFGLFDFIGWTLLITGCCFIIIGAIGCIRMPDFYTRMQAASVSDSAGCTLALIGLAILNGMQLATVKIVILSIIILITSPTGTYALMQSAIANKLKPLGKLKTDIFK